MQAIFEPIDLARSPPIASSFPLGDGEGRPALRVDCRASAAAGLCRPRHVGKDPAQPALQRLQVHAAGESRFGHRVRDRRRQRWSASRDTGIGIAAHELPRLFERFHRIEGAQGRTYEGSGIGLALVQELVRAARRASRSTAPSDGAPTFMLRLPFGHAHLPQDQINPSNSSAVPVKARPYPGRSPLACCPAWRPALRRPRHRRPSWRPGNCLGRRFPASESACCWPTTMPTCATTSAACLKRTAMSSKR